MSFSVGVGGVTLLSPEIQDVDFTAARMRLPYAIHFMVAEEKIVP